MMKTLPFALLVLLVLDRPLGAQNILLKTGQTIETKGVRRSGDMVMGKVQVGASSGEVGYQASTIAKIHFPDPPQLKTTAAFLSQGQPEKALADIEPVVKYYEPSAICPAIFGRRPRCSRFPLSAACSSTNRPRPSATRFAKA